jgi:pimeloyl-ACP methyl ester carboxylesterase
MDAVGVDQPMDFAGSSLGADMALRAAIAAPDRLRRLVLVIPPVAWESGAGQAKQWYFDTADDIEKRGAAAWRDEWSRAEPFPIFAGYPKFDLTPDVADDLLPSVLRGAGMSDLPAQEDIAALRHPTLILAWDTDPLHPVSTAERLRELIPGSELHVAKSVDEIKTWTARAAEFLAR